MIGIYGGTFNPVHFGHLRAALEIKQLLDLEQVRFIPCRLPPHREKPDVSAELRLQMLELAIAGTMDFAIDRRELDRVGPSYMIDTLSSIKGELSGKALVLILGADAFAGLESWHQWRSLLDYAHILVMRRPGSNGQKLTAYFQQRLVSAPAHLRTASAGRLLFQAVTQMDISSTLIRQIIATGSSAQYLLPDAVLAFIQKNGLYQDFLQRDIECKARN